MATRKKNEPSYTESSAELDAILTEIETGDADIDILSEKVARAAELVKICREKLAGTEMRVKKVVEELTAADAASAEE